MANEAHLAQLQQGVGAWNRWRVENPSIQLDLRGVDLSGKNLAEINLMGADLTEASLPHTNLGNAKLLSAALIGANLSGANLSGANLRSAQLVNATLIGANFSGANLRNALLLTTYFVGTELEEADFTVALIGHTTFGNVDLSRVQGLNTIHHVGPFTIGIGTLHRSHSQIPEAFLRGAGVPDDMITYSKSLVGQPFQYYSCFISYSSQDEALAQRLHADLQANGVRCWFAPEDLKIGDEFRSVIDASIQIHDRLLLILSEHSVTSRWVQKEVETAFEKEGKENRIVLFPIRIDEAVIHSTVGWAADVRRQRHIGDFRQWKDHDAYQQAFQRLLRDLKAGI